MKLKYIWLFVGFCCSLYSQENTTVEMRNKKIISDYSNMLKKIIGNVDLSEKYFFRRMVFLKPQPEDKFLEIKNNITINQDIKIHTNLFLSAVMKCKNLPALKSEYPDKYYLRKNEYEESLLMFHGKNEKISFSIQMNFSAIMINLKPNDFNKDKGITKNDVIRLIKTYTNISTISEIEKLLFQPIYHDEIIFAYSKYGLSHIPNWDDDIVCFVSEKGLYIFMFLLFKGRALAGIPRNDNWLDDIRQIKRTGN